MRRRNSSGADDSFRAFVSDIYDHALNPYTGLGLLLAAIVLILRWLGDAGLTDAQRTRVTGSLVLVALLYAAFDAWRDKVRALPGPSDVESSLDTARVEVSGRNVMKVTAAVFIEPLGREPVFLANRRTTAIVAIDALGLSAELTGQWQTPRASNATTDDSGVLLDSPARVTFQVSRPLEPPVSERQWKSGPPRSSVAVLTVRCSGAEPGDDPLIDVCAQLPLHGDTFLWETA